MKPQDEYVLLFPLLADYWDKPLSELPELLQARVNNENFAIATGFSWDELTPIERSLRVNVIDHENDPVKVLENRVAWFDYTMDAWRWWDMQNVTPEEAAKVLCRLNPLECEDPDGIYVDGDRESPRRYKTMLRVFEDVASTSPKHRMLVEWRTIAQQKDLRYHSWIDEYADAVKALAGNQVALVGTATSNLKPTQNWKLKIQAEAARRWKEEVKQGCSPTRNNIKGDLATWCRDNKVKTDGDIFPNEDYIYRHVIRAAIWKSPTD